MQKLGYRERESVLGTERAGVRREVNLEKLILPQAQVISLVHYKYYKEHI